MALGPRARVLVIALSAFAAVGALVWFLSVRYWSQPVRPLPAPGVTPEVLTPTSPPAATQPTPAEATPAAEAAPTSSPVSSPVSSPAPSASPQAQAPQTSQAPSQTSSAEGAGSSRLLIPVAGVRPDQLQDTFTAARSEGRSHDAIDIIAPRGTPVLAAADGRVIKLFNSAKGGITLYQLGTDERTVYYYAHLERYADGMAEGRYARRGETIGYVGDTGNAQPGNCHLHFQVYTITDPKRFWNGNNLNPYPLLRNAQ